MAFVSSTHSIATPFVAGYDLIKAAKLVIDSDNECVWSRWLPFPIPTTSTTAPSQSSSTVHTLLKDAPSKTADEWLDDCLRLVGVHPHHVEFPSTESPSVPSAFPSPSALRPSSPSFKALVQSPSALISSQGPCAHVPSSITHAQSPSTPTILQSPCAHVQSPSALFRPPSTPSTPRASTSQSPRAPSAFQDPWSLSILSTLKPIKSTRWMLKTLHRQIRWMI